jgi:IS5 family transposase
MPKHKENTRSCQKELYRVRNWSEYDRALVNRGSLTIWISEEAIAGWKPDGPKQRGGQKEYSDFAIETALTLKEVFHLTNRGTEGLMGSIFQLMRVYLSVPDHTTLSRRGKDLEVRLPKRKKTDVHLVVDSTGLKLYGEGEWKMRKHGKSNRRIWRKIHLAVDSESGEIQVGFLSEAGLSDAEALTSMLGEIDFQIEDFSADGAYDKRTVYRDVRKHSPDSKIHIPPRKNARIWQHGNCKAPPHPRDENLRYIRRHGRNAWKRDSTYHQRSLAETAMFRMKTIFDGHLSARLLSTQRTQALIRCKALNIMTHQGMPDSYKAAR